MEDIQHKILELCIELDSLAFQVYGAFEEMETDRKMAAFWHGLKADEGSHIRYWRILERTQREGVIPTLVDDPDRVLAKLEECRLEMHGLLGGVGEAGTVQKKLAVACNVEVSFLDQTLLQLLRYVDTVDRGERALEKYTRHLDGFIHAVTAYGGTLELRLLGQTIMRLWTDNRRLLELSTQDLLTDLLNRRGFYQTAVPAANLARRKGDAVAVAMADIDRFKAINDTHGHQEGDRILVRTAAAIRDSVRASDIAGRHGGEEFIILLSPVQPESLEDVGEKIRACVEDSGAGGVPATVSIGVAWCVPSRDDDAVPLLDALARKADEFLYRAKETGRNRVVIGQKG